MSPIFEILVTAVVLGAICAVVLPILAVRLWPLTANAWTSRRQLAKAGFKRTVVYTQVGMQVVWDVGTGPAIVFLHAWGEQAGTWSGVLWDIAYLTRNRVLAVDLAGHGESDPREGPLSIGSLVWALSGVLEAMCGEQPVILIGNSLGAWIAMLYARDHPERVARLIAINGGPLASDREDLSLMPQTWDEARKLFAALRDPGSAAVPDFVMKDTVRQAKHGPIARIAATADEMPNYMLDGRLYEVTVPVDLLWGESDQLFTVAYAERMAHELPLARLTILPKSGHLPHQEHPKEFVAAVTRLLQMDPPARK